MNVSMWVPGVPKPKGSLRVFSRRNGSVGAEEGNAKTVRPWMSCVTLAARDAGATPLDGPVVVGLRFHMPRPKGHFTTKGELRPSAPPFPATKPDLDKLARAILDALKGVAFTDDARVVGLDPAPWKVYAGPRGPGLDVVVRVAGAPGAFA